MSRLTQMGLTAGMMMGAIGFLFARVEFPSVQAQAATFAATGWEYQSISIDAPSLAAKLNELGRDGWEVFALVSTDAIVDNGPDGKPHLTTQRFEVTAKKPKTN